MSNVALKSSNVPPMLQQYLDYKEQYSDALLLFQVGDFYESFFQDAVVIAKALNLTLTSRDKNSPDPVPMCGVPQAVIDNYLERLVNQGYSVAVVSQSVSYSENGKQVVTRFLERIVTPGVRVLSNTSSSGEQGSIAAVSINGEERFSLAISDVYSGVVGIKEGLIFAELLRELLRLNLSELILPSSYEQKKIDKRTSWVAGIVKSLPGVTLKFRVSELLSITNLNNRNFSLISGYSSQSEEARAAIRLLLRYLDEVTVDTALPISEIVKIESNKVLYIDAMTRNNLELVRSLRSGQRDGSFISVLDKTVSPLGNRLLYNWLLAPSIDIAEINSRFDVVEILIAGHQSRHAMIDNLRLTPDLERIAARIEMSVIMPRELAALRDILDRLPSIRTAIENLKETKLLQEIMSGLLVAPELLLMLKNTLHDNPEPTLAQGGVIRDGFDQELDEIRAIRVKGGAWVAELEKLERDKTGISSLRIKFNGVIGYFIEVTNANKDKIPDHYIRRQSTANTERFTTAELKEREKDIVNADSRQVSREKNLYENLKNSIKPFLPSIRTLSTALAKLDVVCSFAELSEGQAFVRPVVNDSADLVIEAGRHPVLLFSLGARFVPNSIQMSTKGTRFLIVTGPNMGGKSTYLRQTALIVIMAQMGCFVPARSAKIGIVDRIFARLGASDNQAEGESTFMVEMKEAAQIVNFASDKSLVLLDEIGRGTATADGIAIAQAIVEWLVQRNKSRSIFATHFHELTGLATVFNSIENFSVASYENDGDVIFTHEIKSGAASRSYGIEVAKLAGLPSDLLIRAKRLILESTELGVQKRADKRQLSIFDKQELLSQPDVQVPQAESSMSNNVRDNARTNLLIEKIVAIDVNNTTPLQAIQLLQELKRDLE
jgi:DNA mismatch repair protein MutS